MTLVLCCGAASQPAAPPDAVTQPEGDEDPLRETQSLVDEMGFVFRAAQGSRQIPETLDKIMTRLDEDDARVASELEELTPRAGAPHVAMPPAARAARREELRVLRCRIALLRADAWRTAASVAEQDEAAKSQWSERALRAYRELRLEYKELPIALMGYIGEARVQRLRGDAAASRAAVGPILNLTRTRKGRFEAELARIARLELLENLLLDKPSEAASEAALLRNAQDFREPSWKGRVGWLLARARTAQILKPEKSPAKPVDADAALKQCIDLLREPEVKGASSSYERLELLAKLEEASGQAILTREELTAWATLLGAGDLPKASALYERAQKMPGGSLPAADLLRYAAVLWKQKEFQTVVSLCDEALAGVDLRAEHRGAGRQLRALALASLYWQSQGRIAREKIRPQATDALLTLFSGDGTEAVRRDALRQWAAIQSDAGGAASCLPVLGQRAELVEGDAYLAYVRAAGEWEQLRTQTASSAPAGEALKERAAGIAARLQQAGQIAAVSGLGDVAARAVLMQARVLAELPLQDKRSALEVLTKGARVLAGAPLVDAEASGFRIELMVSLGLIDAAEEAVSSQPEGRAVAGEPLLNIAAALAQRYATTEAASRGSLQERVVRLCQRALAASVSDAAAYAKVGQHAARCMLLVGASAGAEELLAELLKQQPTKSNTDALLACSLMLAQALQQQGKRQPAAEIYDQLIARYSQNSAVLLARGRFEMELREPAKAVEWFRRARSLCREGSAPWWEATLSLAEALIAARQPEASADILRVSSVLYPECPDAELRIRLKRLQQQTGTE